jgi:hypothetical protein
MKGLMWGKGWEKGVELGLGKGERLEVGKRVGKLGRV